MYSTSISSNSSSSWGEWPSTRSSLWVFAAALSLSSCEAADSVLLETWESWLWLDKSLSRFSWREMTMKKGSLCNLCTGTHVCYHQELNNVPVGLHSHLCHQLWMCKLHFSSPQWPSSSLSVHSDVAWLFAEGPETKKGKLKPLTQTQYTTNAD